MLKTIPGRAIAALDEFLKLESAGGLMLIGAAMLALVCMNTPLSPLYQALFDIPVAVQVGSLAIHKPLLLWINDGLMAVFFLLVALEIKREVLQGQLSSAQQVMLPAVCALGGMLVPALIYVAFNHGDALAINGWAIPAATDIAFALGVLTLFGSRVPASLKMLLMAIAVLDDLGAVVIIALFYTSSLSMTALVGAVVCLALMVTMNLRGVRSITAYLLVGLVLWIFVLKSGVHATLAGVAVGMMIPLRGGDEQEASPLEQLEHTLHPWVAYLILPVFAFANAGVGLLGIGMDALLDPVAIGIAAGLFLGKQAGVFGFAWIACTLGLARRPDDLGWGLIWGLSLLCGIGFTMSLFIGSLAFEQAGGPSLVSDRIGILVGSLLSAVVGAAVLAQLLPRPAQPNSK